jgi:hypothetical protein
MTKLTIMLPDEVAEQVSRRPDRDEFVSRAVADALAQETRQERPSPNESRWARIVHRIETHPVTLGSYLEQARQDRDRFREETLFPHDRS